MTTDRIGGSNRRGNQVAFASSLPTSRTRSTPATTLDPFSFPQFHSHDSIGRQSPISNGVVMYGAASGGGGKLIGRSTTVAGAALTRVAPTVAVAAAALLIGFLLGRRMTGNRNSRLSNAARVGGEDDGMAGLPIIMGDQEKDEGVTPVWLNYGLARLWALFQKSTKRLIQEVIQPVLDETEKPDFVTAVRLTKFSPGKRSPYLRSLRRLPSRALAEVQYSLNSLFSSTSEFVFEVDIKLGKLDVTVPVTLKNMDVDANCWSAFRLAPYEPYCTGVQYALLDIPKISFDLDIAGMIPITAVPVLRSFFFRVLCTEIPKAFIYPKTVSIDFTPEAIRDGKSVTATTRIQDLTNMSEDELRMQYPEQWAFYDTLDLNNDGALSAVELFSGLKDWGYTAQDAAESFERLDLDGDSEVSFSEFCQMWPTLAASFVPSRYQGLLTLYVRGAKNLKLPTMGFADPYTQVTTGDDVEGKQTAVTKRDSQTSGDGVPGAPVWNEAFELNCRDPADEVMEVAVTEGSRWAVRAGGGKGGNVIGRATVPLASLRKRPNQQLTIDLKPQGSLKLDLSYADFVDRRGTL